ncbi:hypothetical protein, partial [Pseudomonas syringae]|uniref:hypothetical protein n=1 Tax=Pseudomonas syringae TaxID=317 RepID=UPI0034D95938
MSRAYCLSRGITIAVVSHWLSVGTPTGVSVDLHEMVRGHQIKFLGRVYVMDLYVHGFSGFDVILGIDWLTKNLVMLDYGRRRIV